MRNRLTLVLLAASLIALGSSSEASAQTAPASADTFSGLVGGRTLLVIDDSGSKATGRLLLFTPDTLTLAVDGSEVVFDRKNVAAVFERRNSVKKGLIFGALSGPALGLAAVVTGGSDEYIAVGVVVFSAIGAAVGTAVDASIPEKRLVYANDSAFERGDSNRNGIILGLVAGAGTGFTAGLFKDDCDHTPTVGPRYFTPLDCTADEKLTHGLKTAALPALVGAGLGAVIDRMMVGRRLIHGSRSHRAPVAISINPSMSRARLGLSTSVVW